ncbi:Os06g0118150, partial [Oryza sativa Japonica Group]
VFFLLQKSGCKFTAEEERVVIELQAQFGNKWARIATYLQGRTDNDMKNFWTARQKRLARLLRGPLPAARSTEQRQGQSVFFIFSRGSPEASRPPIVDFGN